MDLMTLTRTLKANRDAPVEIMLPSGELLPDCFQVLQAGRVQRDFVGGAGESVRESSFVLRASADARCWQQTTAGKLAGLIDKARGAVNFVDGDLPVCVEYGAESTGVYRLSGSESTGVGLLLLLDGQGVLAAPTECL